MSASMDQGNRTFIGSVVFVDIVGYSKKSVTDQITMKDRFTALLSDSLKDVSLEQRIILDTGDGAALSFIGDPEDALFVGMNIRDLLKRQTPDAAEPTDDSTSSGSDLFLRIGINLGPIKLVRDINGQPNIVGDGINVAQRIMSFARPGQVVVSRSFYDVVSVISDEYAQLFKYEGSRTDKHVREHEIYIVGDSAAAFDKARSGMEDRAAATNPHSKPVVNAAKKTGKAPRANAADDETDANTIPFLQDKKKLTIVGGALGLLVIALAVMLALKKPSQPEPLKVEMVAAAPTAKPPGSTIVDPIPAPAMAAIPQAAAPPSTSTPPTTSATQTAIGAPTAANSAKAAVKTDLPKAEAPKADPQKTEPPKVILAQGSISFSIQPWGEVLINGKSIGTSPPIKQHKLAAGKYKIEVRNSTFTPLVTTVDVKPKEELTIRHQFK